MRHAKTVAGQWTRDRKKGIEGITYDRCQCGPQPQARQMRHDQIGEACTSKAYRHCAGSPDAVREITADYSSKTVGQVESGKQDDVNLWGRC